MRLDDELTLIPVEPDQYGDGIPKDGITVPATVEALSGWAHSAYADVRTGEALAITEPWLHPEALPGCEAEHAGVRYRVVSAQQLSSLIASAPGHCELRLERIAPDDATEDGDEELEAADGR